MEVENNKCVICGLILDVNIVTVKERGLLKFIESSTVRDDGKADCFKNRAEIKLHKTCRNTYTNPKCVEAEKKRKKKESEKVSESTGDFDFQNKCLFCDKDASFEFEQQQNKKPLSSRISVGTVKRFDTQKSILKACTTHDDDWSKQVLLRIDEVNILEKKARYHYGCYNKFCHPYRAAGIKRGRPKSQANENPMDQDFEYIKVPVTAEIYIPEIEDKEPNSAQQRPLPVTAEIYIPEIEDKEPNSAQQRPPKRKHDADADTDNPTDKSTPYSQQWAFDLANRQVHEAELLWELQQRQAAMEERQVAAEERQVAAEERRVALEERRVAMAERQERRQAAMDGWLKEFLVQGRRDFLSVLNRIADAAARPRPPAPDFE